MGVAVEDLIQMSIWSYSEFLSVFKICKIIIKLSFFILYSVCVLSLDSFMKKVLKEKADVRFKTVVVQISLAKIS